MEEVGRETALRSAVLGLVFGVWAGLDAAVDTGWLIVVEDSSSSSRLQSANVSNGGLTGAPLGCEMLCW